MERISAGEDSGLSAMQSSPDSRGLEVGSPRLAPASAHRLLPGLTLGGERSAAEDRPLPPKKGPPRRLDGKLDRLLTCRAVHAKHLVPNAITLANIAFGIVSMVASAQGQYERACYLIFAAALCDMLDGKAARLLNASSKFGMELDSLSDAISFGVAPALLVYFSSLQTLGAPGLAIAIAYALCGVLRLARFNVETREISKVTFLGCPIPAGAGYIISFVVVRESLPLWLIAAGTAGIALSLVSTIKVPKFCKGGMPNVILFVGIGLFATLLWKPSALTWHVWNAWNIVFTGVNYVRLYKKGYLGRPSDGGSVSPAA